MTVRMHYKTADGKSWVLKDPMTIKAAARKAREYLHKTRATPTVTEVTLKRIDIITTP